MAIVKRDAATIAKLVSAVLDIRDKLDNDAFLWFRGHTCESHQLIPKIMRDGRAIEDVFEREQRLIARFRQRSLAFWPAGYQQTDWEHMFALQHYGGPTRLLDWTENLFVATFFALSTSHAHEGAECNPVVWCMDPVRWNRATPHLTGLGNTINVLTTVQEEAEIYRPFTPRHRQKSPVAIFGTHNSERIVAQRGTFVVWGNETKALEQHATSNTRENVLWKIRLTGNRDELFRDLQTLGFGETMIFPELTYLAAELDRTEGWH